MPLISLKWLNIRKGWYENMKLKKKEHRKQKPINSKIMTILRLLIQQVCSHSSTFFLFFNKTFIHSGVIFIIFTIIVLIIIIINISDQLVIRSKQHFAYSFRRDNGFKVPKLIKINCNRRKWEINKNKNKNHINSSSSSSPSSNWWKWTGRSNRIVLYHFDTYIKTINVIIIISMRRRR